jgi:segregation and condensation protein B
MDHDQKKRIVEALLLAASEPLTAARIAEIVPRATPARVREWIETLNKEYSEQDRAFEVWEVAGGYQLRTRTELAPWVQQLQKLRAARLSTAALETLSVVAYRQPLTRAEIEQVRGVDVGATLRGLVERKLVRIAGHREVPGRPMIYATTKRFLEVFGLRKLEDLPTLRDLEELAGDEALAALGSPPEVETPDEETPEDATTEEPAADPLAALDPEEAARRDAAPRIWCALAACASTGAWRSWASPPTPRRIALSWTARPWFSRSGASGCSTSRWACSPPRAIPRDDPPCSICCRRRRGRGGSSRWGAWIATPKASSC